MCVFQFFSLEANESHVFYYCQFPADLVTFTEDILNGKFHFLCSEYIAMINLHVTKM